MTYRRRELPGLRNISQHRWGYLRFFTCLCVLFVLLNGTALADVPVFTIDNGYERDQEYDPVDWIVTETFFQMYTLDWGESFTDRLDLDMQFQLGMEDIHNSQDVDTKTVSPYLDLGLVNPYWDFSFTAEDVIEYTNEFNKARKDEIQYSTQFSLFPRLLPALQITYDVLQNQQENLEDNLEKRLDIVSDYSFGDMVILDARWKKDTFDDRLVDFNDKDSESWDVNLSLIQLLTPTLKLNFESTWEGDYEDTLDNAGTVIESNNSEGLENKLLLTLDSFPMVHSDLELFSNREFIDNTHETDINFGFEIAQQFLELGTLIETFELGRNRFRSPVPQNDLTELDFLFSVEFTGVPSQFIGYSIEQSFEAIDSTFADSSLNTDTFNSEFDLSVTIVPFYELVIDTSYNQSTDYEKGSRTGEAQNLKIEMTYEGEALYIPNLIFEPSILFSTETDYVVNDTTRTEEVDLHFIYEFNTPPPLLFILEPGYLIKRIDGVTEDEELRFDYDFSWDVRWRAWTLFFQYLGEYTQPLVEDETTTHDNEFNFEASTVLIGNLFLDVDYSFRTFKEEDKQDALTVNLDWDFYNMILSLAYKNNRTFSLVKEENRTIRAEFFMEF